MSNNNDDFFSEKNRVKTQWVKFGKIGDFLKGTLTDVREMDSRLPGKEGTKVKVYEFKAHAGEFHDSETTVDENGNKMVKILEPAVVLKPDEIWAVGGKPGIDAQMRNVKFGQIFGMRFTDLKPSKNPSFSPQKIIKVYVGGMDQNYQGETLRDVAEAVFPPAE